MGFLPCKIKCPIKGCQKEASAIKTLRHLTQESTVVYVDLNIKQNKKLKTNRGESWQDNKNIAASVRMEMVRSTSTTHAPERKKYHSEEE